LNKFGIMQGRLLPPQDGRLQCFPRAGWEKEFELASQVPFDYIEWIFDVYGYDVNPIAPDNGLDKLVQLRTAHDVDIRAVCADYFMEKTFLSSREEEPSRLQELFELMRKAQKLGANRVVLPFVDTSAIRTEQETLGVVRVLESALPVSKETRVELHLETSLDPEQFRALLDRIPDPMIKVNYDTGNSASLGFVPEEEFGAYGDRIGSVHIKDRKRGAGTVPLGTGNVDFESVFREMKRINYRGDITLQVARGTPGEEVTWARQNIEFVRNFWPR